MVELMHDSSTPSLVILTAIYNDWVCLPELLRRIDAELCAIDRAAEVVIVDDGSTDFSGQELLYELSASMISQIRIVCLLRNLGNQRALAVGIAYLTSEQNSCPLLIMDADHEDDPSYIPLLLSACVEHRDERIVFAGRSKRSEGLFFRFGYFLFQRFFRLLTGHTISVGNFSIIPQQKIKCVAAIGELWSHYPAAIMRARIPIAIVPAQRAKRYAGKSKMNIVALIVHALSSLSVHAETIGARILLASSALSAIIILSLCSLVGLKLFSDIPMLGWTSQIAAILLAVLLQLIVASFIMVFIIVSIRMQPPLVPLREYANFVGSIKKLSLIRSEQ